MNAVNFQASLNNLVQMDRFQQDTSKTPVVNQQQNEVISQDEAEKRIRMPVQPEQPESKIINPDQKKQESFTGKKKKKDKESKENKNTKQGQSTDSGFFIDVQA
jgi:hypothetical protein